VVVKSTLHSIESERAEWETVIADFSRTPRLAKLLRHLGELYFANRADEINEFQIATTVFGRSEVVFDSSSDSIARVEAHRLRKKLKEYYETQAQDHSVVISLPPGGYVPSFFHRPEASTARQPASVGAQTTDLDSSESEGSSNPPDSPAPPVAGQKDLPESPKMSSRWRPGRKVLWAFGAVVLLSCATIFLLRKHTARQDQGGVQNGAAAASESAPPPTGQDGAPIRLLCGYDGAPRIDSSGAYWAADSYFAGGIARARPDPYITRTSDPMLFDHWRLDEMKYDIPLKPGPYELHLYFVAPTNDEAGRSYIEVLINGKTLLTGFNIRDDAQGADVADERIFKDIYPAEDGKLHLAFTSEKSTPSINAIEIIPGIPHKQLPIRLVAQSSAVRDHLGNLWHSDAYALGGSITDQPEIVTGTPDPKLYAQERFGHFSYAIPVDPRGRYTLILHFAELYWAADPGVGRRVFNVYCNGKTLLENFDIFKEAGSLHGLAKTFSHLKPTKEGKLDITFEPIENNATVSAIEVIDESE
jgi:hypothetical protein